MNGYKILQDDGDVMEGISEVNQNHSNWVDHGGAMVYERPQSRQHTGTEVAFWNVCYEIPVKENKEKKLKNLLFNVRLEC